MLYLLHLHSSTSVSHYIGTTKPGRLKQRMQEHARSSSSPHVADWLQKGGSFRVARVWLQGSYAEELALKKQHNPTDLCPICQQNNLDPIAEQLGTFFLAEPAEPKAPYAL